MSRNGARLPRPLNRVGEVKVTLCFMTIFPDLVSNLHGVLGVRCFLINSNRKLVCLLSNQQCLKNLLQNLSVSIRQGTPELRNCIMVSKSSYIPVCVFVRVVHFCVYEFVHVFVT